MLKTFLFCAVLALAVSSPPKFRIPANAARYRADLIREAHAKGGLQAPVPMFAAQLTQESGFNPNAHSGVGAQGLGQFMPPTAQWLSKIAPKDFPTANALDPQWSIRALIWYDYWLAARLPKFRPGDDKWSAALSAYNGGLGWVYKDQKAATCDASLWFDCVANVQDKRTPANYAQNRDYPERILHKIRPAYVAAGWN